MRIVVHNVPLQVMAEAGVPTGLLWCALLGLPLLWLLRSRRVNSSEGLFALLLNVSQIVNWMFHPMSTERHVWLLFAIVTGMAYRLRCQRVGDIVQKTSYDQIYDEHAFGAVAAVDVDLGG